MWPRNDGSSTPSTISVAAERGLANWPAMRPIFSTGTPVRVGEHHGHLQDDLELVADGVGRERVERLCAVAGLQQERLALGDLGELVGQRTGLAGEHERRQRPEVLERPVEGTAVGPRRLLGGGPVTPRVGGPASGGGVTGHGAPSWLSERPESKANRAAPKGCAT